MRVTCLIGTRPEAIKLGPVVRALRSHPEALVSVCTTGQHTDLVREPLGLFDIEPDVCLDLMQADQTPTDVAARVLDSLPGVFARLCPDWLVVQGDTTSAFAAALAALYARVRVVHVEAGLRTGAKWAPFPEEMNRRLITVLTDLHCAPTPRARENLLSEGISATRLVMTGNPVVVALRFLTRQPLPSAGVDDQRWLDALADPDRKVVLVTSHRRENHVALQQICDAVIRIDDALGADDIVLLPVHPHPTVRDQLRASLAGRRGIVLSPPLGYRLMLHAIEHADAVLTDSGGIQEEACALGRPAIVLREVTERPEAVEMGLHTLVGTDPDRIVAAALRALERAPVTRPPSDSPYGDGHAAERIVAAIAHADAEQRPSAR